VSRSSRGTVRWANISPISCRSVNTSHHAFAYAGPKSFARLAFTGPQAHHYASCQGAWPELHFDPEKVDQGENAYDLVIRQ
jgi:hypothetical protein